MARSTYPGPAQDNAAACGGGARREHDEAARIALLTGRQREVLELLAKGLSNEQIGIALSLSIATVRTHVAATLKTLEVGNRTEATAAYVAYSAHTGQVAVVLDRPAITVLPLQALDEEPASRQIAVGLSSDLTSLFARWCWFPVVQNGYAPHAPIGQPPAQLGRALGVRFVVSGDVRSRSSGLRIQIRIDDTHTQNCLWTERYDIAMHELFAVEDSLCADIVATAYPMLVARLGLHPIDASDPSLCAWTLAHEGMLLRARREAAASIEASARFVAALERDPALVLAHFGLGLVSYDQVLNQFSAPVQAFERLALCAERCITLAPHAAEGYYLRGRYFQARGERSLAMRTLEEAIGRNPSFGAAHALLAQEQALTGQGDMGLARIRHAVRIGPRSYGSGLAVVHFIRKEYVEALAAAEQALGITPAYPFARGVASASAFWLGRIDTAQGHYQELRRIAPAFVPSTFQHSFGATADAIDRMVAALDKVRLSL